MRQLHKSRRKGGATYRWFIEPGEKFDNIAEAIGKASGNIFDGQPSEMIGTADRRTGRILRVKATYGPGETIVMRIRKDMSYSISFGLRVTSKVSS